MFLLMREGAKGRCPTVAKEYEYEPFAWWLTWAVLGLLMQEN